MGEDSVGEFGVYGRRGWVSVEGPGQARTAEGKAV